VTRVIKGWCHVKSFGNKRRAVTWKGCFHRSMFIWTLFIVLVCKIDPYVCARPCTQKWMWKMATNKVNVKYLHRHEGGILCKSYPITLVLLVSKVNISPSSSSEAPAVAPGDTRRLSRGREPFVLILQHEITASIKTTCSSNCISWIDHPLN
jgi:hypothetical protein